MENTSPKPLFNERRIHAKRTRAIRINNSSADFLAKIAAETLGDRLSAISREFEQAADVHSLFNCMSDELEKAPNVHEVRRIGGFIFGSEIEDTLDITHKLEPKSLNLVVSVFGLHWMNHLPKTLGQIHRSLQADGLFMAAIPGDRTLKELRECLIEAESKLTGNVSLRIDPLGEVRQYGSLLQRAGFTLPVVDTEVLTVRYKSVKALINDLRAMGVTSALNDAQKSVPRKLFEETQRIYSERYADPDGKIRVTFEIIYLLGWTPHVSQQKPLKPGSAKFSMKDVL